VRLYALGGWLLGATGLDRAISSASYLHRAGLALAWAGSPRMALRLLSSSARRYRREDQVVDLARLRVNEIMVRFQAAEDSDERRDLNEEIVLRMSRLEEVEATEPPFAPLPTSGLLAEWMSRGTFLLGAGGVDEVEIQEDVDLPKAA
jgi:hypothetical protein